MSRVACVEVYEIPTALGKSAVGRQAVDWTKMGSSVISLAETWPSIDSAESRNDNTTSRKPEMKYDSLHLILKNLQDKDDKSAPKAGQSPPMYNHADVLVACKADRSRRAALPKEPKLRSAPIWDRLLCMAHNGDTASNGGAPRFTPCLPPYQAC